MPAMKKLFAQAPFPQFYDLLRHVGEKHADDIGGLVYQTADTSLLSEARFSTVPIFLGGEWYPYAGNGTRYYEGMMNDQWRWEMIQAQKAATINGLNVLGDRRCEGFYITEEIDISSLVNVALRTRIEWFLLDILRFYYSLDPLAPVLWSPFASSRLLSLSQINLFRQLLINVFAWLKNNDKISPLLQIHFQDGVGAKTHSLIGARQWGIGIRDAIRSAPVLSTVSFHMNVEMFVIDDAGNYSYETAEEIAERENSYWLSGLDIGACWEGRYWRPYIGYLNNHPEAP